MTSSLTAAVGDVWEHLSLQGKKSEEDKLDTETAQHLELASYDIKLRDSSRSPNAEVHKDSPDINNVAAQEEYPKQDDGQDKLCDSTTDTFEEVGELEPQKQEQMEGEVVLELVGQALSGMYKDQAHSAFLARLTAVLAALYTHPDIVISAIQNVRDLDSFLDDWLDLLDREKLSKTQRKVWLLGLIALIKRSGSRPHAVTSRASRIAGAALNMLQTGANYSHPTTWGTETTAKDPCNKALLCANQNDTVSSAGIPTLDELSLQQQCLHRSKRQLCLKLEEPTLEVEHFPVLARHDSGPLFFDVRSNGGSTDEIDAVNTVVNNTKPRSVSSIEELGMQPYDPADSTPSLSEDQTDDQSVNDMLCSIINSVFNDADDVANSPVTCEAMTSNCRESEFGSIDCKLGDQKYQGSEETEEELIESECQEKLYNMDFYMALRKINICSGCLPKMFVKSLEECEREDQEWYHLLTKDLNRQAWCKLDQVKTHLRTVKEERDALSELFPDDKEWEKENECMNHGIFSPVPVLEVVNRFFKHASD